MKDTYEKISKLIKENQEHQQEMSHYYINIAYQSIKNKEKGSLNIELILSGLASMIYLDGVQEAFVALFNYYHCINKEDAKFAFESYKEIYGLEDKDLVLKRKK